MSNLYVIATPIGNLEDFSQRGINTLKTADLILAEDTRVTRKLLSCYEITTPVISYHSHSTLQKIDFIIEQLKDSKSCALVSDAGTPGINDPGSYLIKKIMEVLPETKVVPIPGANAAMAALSVSGFPADEFIYLGFPPHKKGRQTFFKRIKDIESTIVLYESKHRIVKALVELKELSELGDRQIMVARELTKQFETIYRGTIDEIIPQLHDENILGELVIVISAK